MTVFELYQLLERELSDPPGVAVEALHDGALIVIGDEEFWVTAKKEDQ